MSYNLNLKYFSFVDDILPIVNKCSGKIFVIKYGGSIMLNDKLKFKIVQDISFLHSLGVKIILVHGGGPLINNYLSKLNIQPSFQDGIRVTDDTTIEIVEMVLSGKINKDLVSLLNQNNVLSVGLSGKDANIVMSSPFSSDLSNLVGKIDSIDNKFLRLLLANNYIPVISSISPGYNNKTYNINADIFAGFIAKSLLADKLILLTDIPGVMFNINDPSTIIKRLTLSQINDLKESSVISGGMIPKVDCCVQALQAGVKSAHIIDGKLEHSLLYELLTDSGIGSRIIL
uniref:Acetylglutamate kinase n=1 Tax=Taenioma perpusillum TaxID=210852 RepID=A0A1Z1MR71_9FLOR|nr:acetylglutamate kinase [Taenioma perpusillum]ARW68578.1 acetylglutamate kinase [Taenioma perpusillum]